MPRKKKDFLPEYLEIIRNFLNFAEKQEAESYVQQI